MKKVFLLVLVSFCWLLGATLINVPADYATIQAGINATVDGDTVLVQPGTYVENINFFAKTICLISSAGAEETIIDGNQEGSVVTMTSDELIETSPVLDGFTLTNGNTDGGGGIKCGLMNPIFKNLIITNNHADGGGGILLVSSDAYFENIVISNNSALNGGGVYDWSSSNFMNTIIANNTATYAGGGIYMAGGGGAQPYLSQTLIINNTAERGGAIYTNALSDLRSLLNVTIANNTASVNGGGIHASDNLWGEISLQNCIMWNNLPEETYGDQISIAYSDIQGNWEGIGNIDADPLFVDAAGGDYHLTEFSPCIDAGDPTSPFDPDGTIADMGAFYYHQDVGINDNELPVNNYNLTNHPNPFTGETTISFSLTTNLHENTRIEIFNIKGQLVKQLVVNPESVRDGLGNQQIIWNANKFANGVYFYKLVVDGKAIDTKKMILLK